ncbi:hypothetical protein PD653_2141 [Nocardioides sp. PD653]|nr:hypothetical protein PD653_2141 [Nocardioides sp. PD653]
MSDQPIVVQLAEAYIRLEDAKIRARAYAEQLRAGLPTDRPPWWPTRDGPFG